MRRKLSARQKIFALELHRLVALTARQINITIPPINARPFIFYSRRELPQVAGINKRARDI